jgi:hypothetical protein
MEDLGTSLKGDVDVLVGRTAFKRSEGFEAALNGILEQMKNARPNALIQFMNLYTVAADSVADTTSGET